MKRNNLKQLISSKGLLIIIILAFVYRMSLFILLQPWNPEVVNNTVITGDALEYHPLALSIMSEKSFAEFSTIRTPGYPLFVALIYSISSSSVWVVLLVQILLSLVSVFLVYKITEAFLSHKIALMSAFLFAIDTTQAVWTVELYTETLFTLIFLASIYLLSKYFKEKRFVNLCLSALLLGLATLVKPILFLFPVVPIIAVSIIREVKIAKKLFHSLAFLLIFLITLSPWLIHNYTKHGEAKLTSISGFNLLMYNVAYTEVSNTGKTINQVRRDFSVEAAELGADTTNIHSFENSEIFSSLAKQYIHNNLLSYAKRHLMGTINMYAGLGTQKVNALLHLKTETKNSDPFAGPGIIKRIVNFVQEKTVVTLVIAFLLGFYLLFNYSFSLYGISVLWRHKDLIWVLFILIILYFSALTGVVGYDRYRIPFMPFINILCATGLFSFFDMVTGQSKQKKKKLYIGLSERLKQSIRMQLTFKE